MKIHQPSLTIMKGHEVTKGFSDLLQILAEIDADYSLTKLNESTIADNNGERIEL